MQELQYRMTALLALGVTVCIGVTGGPAVDAFWAQPRLVWTGIALALWAVVGWHALKPAMCRIQDPINASLAATGMSIVFVLPALVFALIGPSVAALQRLP